MRSWVWLVGVLLAGCFGPSQEQIDCYQGCGREKDSCMLAAASAQQIQECDQRSSRCTAVCQ